jgi:hypothetical protein
MKSLVFLISHIGSDSQLLFNSLNQTKQVMGISMGTYSDPHILSYLDSIPHKLRNSAAIYMDHLLFNFMLSSKAFYKICRFIYLVREARPSITNIIENQYKVLPAARYYAFRLRRICEMCKQTPGAVFLTWEDIATGRGLPLIKQYLNLKENLIKPEMPMATQTELPLDIIQKAQESYERYLYISQQFNLVRV